VVSSLFLPLRLITEITRMVRRSIFNSVKAEIGKLLEAASQATIGQLQSAQKFASLLNQIKALYGIVISYFNGDASILNAMNQVRTETISSLMNTQFQSIGHHICGQNERQSSQ